MSSLITKTTILLALTSLLTSQVSASLCPSFTLTASAPGREWDGQQILQSGRSTYLTTGTITPPDGIATFFQNDTTHLYATNFYVSYMSEHETGPFMLVTLNDGFPLFDNDPEVNLAGEEWTEGRFNVSGEYVGFLPMGVGFAAANNASSVGGWWVCYSPSPPSLAQVAQVQLGVVGNTQDLIEDGCVQTLFKITDVNVTAAPFC